MSTLQTNKSPICVDCSPNQQAAMSAEFIGG